MTIFSNWTNRKKKKELKELKKHIKYILHVNDDILTKSAKKDVNTILEEADNIDQSNPEATTEFTKQASSRIMKILPRKSYPTWREYADILAVALCVAFGVRALFLQPFKIPTSSMQPTLFGIHFIEDKDTLPHLPGPLHYLLYSTQRAKCVIQRSGELNPNSIHTVNKYIMFPWTKFNIAGITYQLPGMPGKVDKYALKARMNFTQGQTLCNGWLSLGDHLFVDRFTYHFREPKRGDVLVFNTENIYHGERCLAKNGYYYIKRLIGLPGDTLSIKDNMIYIKARGSSETLPITKFNPVFNKLYSEKGGYHGHVIPLNSQHLSSENTTFTVPDDNYFALGDNSLNSLDSRYWGTVPRKNIIGRGYFVFWPFSRRWGFVDSAPPLNTPTSFGLPSMNLQ